MSSGINKVILVGNLGQDPEVRYGKDGGGTAVCNLRVACTERRKDGDNWKDHTEWVNVVTFGKTAENVGQYLEKGRQVYVEGRLQTRDYEKDGVKRYVTEVVANQVLFLGGNPEKGAARRERPSAEPGPMESQAGDGKGFVDDDLPF